MADPVRAQSTCGRLVHFAGDASQGSLVCFHPAGGLAAVYRRLAFHMPRKFGVFGVDAPVASCSRYTIGALTDGYAQLVRTANLPHPLYLCGWSLGGDLALGCASLLQGSRSYPASLILIDSAMDYSKMPAFRSSAPDYAAWKWIFFANVILGPSASTALLETDQFKTADADERIRLIYATRSGLKSLPQIKIVEDNPLWQFNMVTEVAESLCGYKSPSCDIKNVLYIGSVGTGKERIKYILDTYSPSFFETLLMDCSHEAIMLDTAKVKVVARAIASHLEMLEGPS